MNPRHIILIALICFCSAWFANEMYSLHTIGKPPPPPVHHCNIPLPADERVTFDAPFIRVVDGDTIKVLWNGLKISVRMLNIDTPAEESLHLINCSARNSHRSFSQRESVGCCLSWHSGLSGTVPRHPATPTCRLLQPNVIAITLGGCLIFPSSVDSVIM